MSKSCLRWRRDVRGVRFTDDPDFDIAQRVKKFWAAVVAANQERNIWTLANASFSYDAEHRWYGNIVNISVFIHARDQNRDCTVESYIQDSHVLDKHWIWFHMLPQSPLRFECRPLLLAIEWANLLPRFSWFYSLPSIGCVCAAAVGVLTMPSLLPLEGLCWRGNTHAALQISSTYKNLWPLPDLLNHDFLS